MTQEDFINAYILLFSGAAQMKNDKEMMWKDKRNNDITIEFPYLTLDYAIVRYYYEDNNKKIEWECEYKNGLRHGKSIVWYKNGNKKRETGMRDGKFDGRHYEWKKNGKLDYMQVYQNGIIIK